MHGGEGDRDQKFPGVGRWNFGLGPPGWGRGLAAAVSTLAAALFLDFPAASLGAAVVLGSDF